MKQHRCGAIEPKLTAFTTVGVRVQVTDTDALEGAPATFQLLDASDYWEVCSCRAEFQVVMAAQYPRPKYPNL
jgi:hypothetical protein